MGVGECSRSPAIRSRSFSEPMPLDYELHKCSLLFPLPLGGTVGRDSWSELELGTSLPPGQFKL